MTQKTPKIGTEKESSLHRSLKFRYTGSEDRTEAMVGNYVCDGISDSGEIIEVQTGSFGPLKRKIQDLADQGSVRIIHPIIVSKSIELRDTAGALISLRKSPRRGNEWDLFKALLYAPLLSRTKGVVIELAMVDVLEKRVQDGRGSWRRKGVSIVDKELTALRHSLPLTSPRDYRFFVPFPAGAEFTVRALAAQAHIRPEIAGKALYVLTKLEVVDRIRKEKKAWIYKLND
jgi:hypothetical protein